MKQCRKNDSMSQISKDLLNIAKEGNRGKWSVKSTLSRMSENEKDGWNTYENLSFDYWAVFYVNVSAALVTSLRPSAD